MIGRAMECYVCLLLAVMVELCMSKQSIAIFQGSDYSHVDFAVFAALTENLTKPAILRDFFDARDWADICDCTSTIFHGFRLPDVKGNNRINNATVLESMEAHDFYAHRACQNTTDYMFYDAESGSTSDSAFAKFNHKLRHKYSLTTRFEDATYSSNWYNELFLGGQPYEFPLPSKSIGGSFPHRAPVLNYFIQVCGSKQWTIHPMQTKFVPPAHTDDIFEGDFSLYGKLNGTTPTIIVHPEQQEMERRLIEYDEHEDALHGFTHPGDLLLNPPWLWHMIRNGAGLNFAVTFKQNGFALWSCVKNAPDVNQYSLQRALSGSYHLPGDAIPTWYHVGYSHARAVNGISAPLTKSWKELLDVRTSLYTILLLSIAGLLWRQSRHGNIHQIFSNA